MAAKSSDAQHPLSVPDRGVLAELGTANLARTDSNKEATVTELGDDTLRAAIRFVPVARALKADLEESIHMENYQGVGDVALRSFRTLQTSIGQITGDSFIVALGADLPDDASDKEKVWQALLSCRSVGCLPRPTSRISEREPGGTRQEVPELQTAHYRQYHGDQSRQDHRADQQASPRR